MQVRILTAWRWLCLFLICSVSLPASGSLTVYPCGLQISILTCGPGADLYSIYGHSAIRILDSCQQTDIVYNYGTFSFSDPDFYLKFTRGKLDYYLGTESFPGFMAQYQEEGRRVDEQILLLSAEEAIQVRDFLVNNALPANRNYRYDFLFDNCSTRIRDIFSNLFKDQFVYGIAMQDDSISFRTLLNHYERNLHWERVGINLLMSDIVDRSMKSDESMFLPDYLQKGFATARLNGRFIVGSEKNLLPNRWEPHASGNEPLFFFLVFAAAYFLLGRLKTLKSVMIYLDSALFLTAGLLGLLMLFMWFGTDHKVCAWNRNLFWAFPLHLIFAGMLSFKSDKVSTYARSASWLITLSLIYQFFAQQKFDIEILPLILIIWLRLRYYAGAFKWQAAQIFTR